MRHTILLTLLALIATGSFSCKTGSGNVRGDLQEESATDPEPSYRNGVAVLDAGADAKRTDYEKAFGYFENACQTATPHNISEDPENPRMSKDLRQPAFFYNAAWAAERLGRTSDAEDYYQRALEVDSGYTPALINLAQLYAQSGRSGKAADIYEQYMEDNDEDVAMMLNLAGALGEAGDLERAEHWIQQVLFNEPENDQAYKVLARAYYQLGKYDMALLLNEMASNIKEEDSEIRNTMGLTYMRQDDEVRAGEQFQKARELDPTNLEANLNLGFLALGSGDFQLAAECFNAVLQRYPGNIDAHLGLAVAYRGIADFDSAIAEYDTILGIDSCNKLALVNKASIQDILQQKYQDSLKTLDVYVQCHGTPEVAEQISMVTQHKMDLEDQQRQAAELERITKERMANAKIEGEKLQKLIERAYMLYDLYGERADAIDFSFNEALNFYVLQAEDSIALGDDPDYIVACAGYLDTFILDEYLRALEENEKLEDWSRPREDLWNDPEALKEEKARRESGDDAPPAEGGDAAPAEGGEEAAPVEGGEEAAPAEGGEEAAPAEGGEEAAPAEGGEEAAPAEGGEEAAPAEGGEEAAAEPAVDEAPAEEADGDPAPAE